MKNGAAKHHKLDIPVLLSYHSTHHILTSSSSVAVTPLPVLSFRNPPNQSLPTNRLITQLVQRILRPLNHILALDLPIIIRLNDSLRQQSR